MRAFDDSEVIHVEDRVDPIEDIQIITRELRLKDIAALERIVADIRKQIPRGLKKEQKEELASAEKVLAWLQEGKEIRNGMDNWTVKDVDFLNENNFLSSKPVVYLVNLSPEDFAHKKNKWLAKIADWVQNNGGGKIIPFSGKIESELQEMPEDERAKYCAEKNIESSLPKIIKTGFAAIHLIYFFTAGEDECKCWTIRRGYKAPQAAGVIHGDFERREKKREIRRWIVAAVAPDDSRFSSWMHKTEAARSLSTAEDSSAPRSWRSTSLRRLGARWLSRPRAATARRGRHTCVMS